MNPQIAPIFTNIHDLRSGFERAYGSAANARMVYFNFDQDIHGNYREKAILAAFEEFAFGYATGQNGHGLHVKISHENVNFSVVANELIREMLSADFQKAIENKSDKFVEKLNDRLIWRITSGTRLGCKKSVVMDDTAEIAFTIDKTYLVKSMHPIADPPYVTLVNDQGADHKMGAQHLRTFFKVC